VSYKIVYGYRFNPNKLLRYTDCIEEDQDFLIQKEFQNTIANRSVLLFRIPEINQMVLGIPLCYLTPNQKINENSISLNPQTIEKKTLIKIWGEKNLIKDSEKLKPELYFF